MHSAICAGNRVNMNETGGEKLGCVVVASCSDDLNISRRSHDDSTSPNLRLCNLRLRKIADKSFLQIVGEGVGRAKAPCHVITGICARGRPVVLKLPHVGHLGHPFGHSQPCAVEVGKSTDTSDARSPTSVHARCGTKSPRRVRSQKTPSEVSEVGRNSIYGHLGRLFDHARSCGVRIWVWLRTARTPFGALPTIQSELDFHRVA